MVVRFLVTAWGFAVILGLTARSLLCAFEQPVGYFLAIDVDLFAGPQVLHRDRSRRRLPRRHHHAVRGTRLVGRRPLLLARTPTVRAVGGEAAPAQLVQQYRGVG